MGGGWGEDGGRREETSRAAGPNRLSGCVSALRLLIRRLSCRRDEANSWAELPVQVQV